MQRGRIKVRKRKEEEKLRTAIPVFVSQVSETEINGQFESVCESVFSEVESQAMEALDLPGSFRTRSHSYLRAIQAGYSQDDDCLPSMTSSTVTSTLRSTTGKTIPPLNERGLRLHILIHPIHGHKLDIPTYVQWGTLELQRCRAEWSQLFSLEAMVCVCLFLPLHTPNCWDGFACVLLCTIHASLAKLLVGHLWCCQAVD